MVNLIPKPAKKITKNQKILLYFLVFLVISLTVAYVLLISMKKEANARITELENQIEAQKTEDFAEIEETVKEYKSRVDEFTPFLEGHNILTKFFEFIEDNTHPRVYFSQLSLTANSSSVNLAGEADSFLSLGQQLIIFNKNDLVDGVSLSNISLSDQGGVLFSLRLILDNSLFRY